MDLTEPCQGPGILLIFSPCFLLYKKQFSPDFVSQNLALTLCLFITYICSYSLNLVISELYVADSFFFLIVKERLIFIISLTFLLAYIYIHQADTSFLCMQYDCESIIRTYLVSCILWLFQSSYSATGRTSDGDLGACLVAQSSVICHSQSETQRTTRNQHVYRELTAIN